MKRALILTVCLLIFASLSHAQEFYFVPTGQPFDMAWSAADPAGVGYEVERWNAVDLWKPLSSVTNNKMTDTLNTEGLIVNYRVRAFNLVPVVDSQGARDHKVYGPWSDSSLPIIAGTAPTIPGKPGTIIINLQINISFNLAGGLPEE